MATFDPDAYLAKKSAFDPDAYLAKQPQGDGYDGARAIGRVMRDAMAGAVRGAGSIGATLLAPRDAAENFIARTMGAPQLQVGDRRQAMTNALGSMGADTDSLAFGASKLGAEVLGTSGVGGALSKPAGMVLNKVAPSVSPMVVNALRSAGMTTGAAPTTLGAKAADLALRTGAGAVVGGASAGLVNPEDAGTGAMFGGAIPGSVKAAGLLGAGTKRAISSTAKNLLGLSTGAGSEAVSGAYQAGKQGGTAFLDNLRGKVPFTDVLDEAKTALTQMRIDRSNQYRQGMAGVSADKTVLDFAPIESAVNSLRSMGSFKGQVIGKNAAGTVDELSDLVSRWKSLDPAEFHTPEGLDALKQAIGDIRDATQFGSPARRAADTAYNAVKGQITKQAPTYSKVMKDYTEASELIKEIERSLVGTDKTAADTAMRKLQSLMRNNVNTNYGNRLDLARKLEQNGAEILPAVAGQALSSATPRGLQGLASSGAGLVGLATMNPYMLASLPATSPRLVGEVAYGLGALNRGVGSVSQNALSQLLSQGNRQALANNMSPLLANSLVLSASQR